MKIKFCSVIFHILIICHFQAQAQLPDTSEQKIDAIFEQMNEATPGYMIGIIQDTSFLFQKGYGLANLDYQIPVTANTAFNIASLSKQFTAACIALLIMEDQLSLEDDVRKYLPDFPKYKHPIQIKHLIYMTSGINDYYYNERENEQDWSSLQFFNIDMAIEASLSNKRLMYQPGTQWSYSNINYMLLTKVVEKISGKSFSSFIKARLFEPLGMQNTLVHDDIFQVIPNRAMGYNYRDEENTNWMLENGYLQARGEGFLQIHRNSPHYGGSGVYTTMNDLKKWIANFETKAFGGQQFYDLLHQTMKFEHDKTNDAFGLVFGDFNGHEIVWYEGGDWGFSSYLMRFPKNGLTVVCFSNLGTGNARQYVNQIVDILVEDELIELK
ncbi:MAG: serine hydrolase domain-containing protein [Bacteroidota bacterium]